MMPRTPLSREELVLRAIQEAHWDPANQRASSSIFEGPNISLSRLAVLDQLAIFGIFLRDLDKPKNAVIAAGRISVGQIQDIAISHPERPISLIVVADPLQDNPAHAVIPEKISRGISRRIRDQLEVIPIPRT